MKHGVWTLSALLAAAALAAPARASTFLAMEREELVAQAEAVVLGRVVEVSSFVEPRAHRNPDRGDLRGRGHGRRRGRPARRPRRQRVGLRPALAGAHLGLRARPHRRQPRRRRALDPRRRRRAHEGHQRHHLYDRRLEQRGLRHRDQGARGLGPTTRPVSTPSTARASARLSTPTPNYIGTAGSTQYQPCGTYYWSNAGWNYGRLRGPSGSDFDLYLWRWNGTSWVQVASATSLSNNEDINYNNTSAAWLLWGVYSYSGSGTYHFYLDRQ